MFTLTMHDEQLYQELIKRAAQQGISIDDLLRELLDQQLNLPVPDTETTPAQKLLALIDAADLPFDHPFDARDAEEILSREASSIKWRAAQDDDVTP